MKPTIFSRPSSGFASPEKHSSTPVPTRSPGRISGARHRQTAAADHQRVAVQQDRRGLRCIFSVNPKSFPIAHAGMGMTLRDLARFGLLFTASGQSANEPAVPPAFLKALLEKSVPTCKPATSRHGSATPRISGTASAARAAVERLRKLALPHSTLCCIAQCRHTAPAAASPAPLPD